MHASASWLWRRLMCAAVVAATAVPGIVAAQSPTEPPTQTSAAAAGTTEEASLLVRIAELDDDPEVSLVGIPAQDDGGSVFKETLVEEVASAVESIPRHRRRDRDVVAQAARRAIRSHMNQRWGKKPVTHVFVVNLA